MVKKDLLNENIICLDIEAQNSEDAIKKLGGMLMRNKYIEASYTDSVILREQNFPTGLVLANAGIAIPHATPSNDVLKDGIAAVRLKSPVEFRCMEDPERKINVNMVFMLALHGSNKHLEILKKLFVMFQNEDLIENLQKSRNETEFLKLLANSLEQ